MTKERVLDTFSFALDQNKGRDDRLALSLFTATASGLEQGSQEEKCHKVSLAAANSVKTAWLVWLLLEIFVLYFATCVAVLAKKIVRTADAVHATATAVVCPAQCAA